MKNFTIEDAKELLKKDVVTFQDFQDFTTLTEVYKTRFHALICCGFGLVEESEELNDADNSKDILLEAGDVMWKIATLSRCFNFEVLDIFESGINSAPFSIMKLAGAFKRMFRSHNLDDAKHIATVKKECINLKDAILQLYDNNLTEVYKANISKLLKRIEQGSIIDESKR